MQEARYQRAKKAIQSAYKNINPSYLSKQTRAEMNLDSDEFIYGEIDPQSLINLIEITKPKAHDIFYDLGSGAGRAAIAAALCFDFSKVIGIEYFSSLSLLSQNQWSLIQAENPKCSAALSFIKGDFFEIDFSNANIIFFNATACRGDRWLQMLAKFKTLPIGTRLIISSHRLSDPKMFKVLYEGLQLMSWGMNSVYIYKKII